MQLSAPEPLGASHRVDDFSCGEPVLNDWLRRRALANQATGASRTFVVADQDDRVLGYYAMAAGAVARALAPGTVRRNMPEPVPVLVLARLAVDRQVQGRHLGAALLKDAVGRAVAVAGNAGVRALLTHARNDEARRFYAHFGFRPAPTDPLTLMLVLGKLKG